MTHAAAHRLRYEHSPARVYYDYWESRLLAHVPSETRRVLDVGCGIGSFVAKLRGLFQEALGLDCDSEMVRVADHPSVRLSDASRIDIPDGSICAVFIRGVLHHLEEPSSALKEAWRLLRPGGRLIISEPCHDGPVLRLLRRLLIPRIRYFDGLHKNDFSSRLLKTSVRAADFEIIHTERFGHIGFPLCALSDLSKVMRFFPLADQVARLLVRVDKVCVNIPIIRRECWHFIVVAEKAADSEPEA